METINKIKETDSFKILTQNQQKQIVEKKRWLKPPWVSIAANTEIGEYWAKMFYSYFSGYTHTTSSSIIQLKKPPLVVIVWSCLIFS